MKLITFVNKNNAERIGWLTSNNGIVDMQLAHANLPNTMLQFIDEHELYFDLINKNSLLNTPAHYSITEVRLLPPLPNPRSFRDYIGFETHMLNASKSFGHTIAQAWYDMPIFYFTNHQNLYGHNDVIVAPKAETKLDIELEMAVIIGKKGKDIVAENANDYIFGYTVFNDFTARAIQKREMEIPLGPHKGKDFANSIGPCIVTKDEMEKYRGADDKFDVKMTAKINGITICEGNYNSIYHPFEKMIERAAENNVTLMPGDILGSGTVGWGSLIENNFSVHRPLQSGDIVELEIEGIGLLSNTIQ